MADKIDFSKLERLTPREDSWAKVCARLDAESSAAPTKGKIISIKSWYSAIPIAASIALVALTAILPEFTDNINNEEIQSNEYVSISDSAPSEVLSWYSNLGNSASDEFETLEETVGFSYLIKE
ncbi:MAG: hypothetical protein J5615_04930 [Fibrobacter sp.]|nr:hypothetical protein [Fibrobacter sp.]